MPTRVAIVGTGLIGGSLGLALRGSSEAVTVVGFDVDGSAARAALDRGALDEVAPSAAAAAAGADVVVLAAPIHAIADTCRQLAGGIGDGTVVTDVGSTKREVVAVGQSAFGDRFVGGHPMTGSERHGVEAADEALFRESWWILTPTEQTASDAYATVARLVGGVGAKPVALGADDHDALVARLSHLPQLAASALVDFAVAAGDREALLGLAGAGFRDVTRIAASHPDMWVAIIRSNSSAVLDGLGGLRDRLESLAETIAGGRWDELGGWLARARAARLDLFAKPHLTGEPVTLTMVIPDRPGVLAEVTTQAGELGANIEDLRIVHSTEGGSGRLELVVAGTEAAEALAGRLIALGYHVLRGSVDS
jgi:prephenate dehydrogenase